ncbi:MAG: hypothetical protein A3A28_00570 [Candidatus Sungbacteria bacterium RIFCSPLOWO2_01_FULL_47_32]|nr:MAG: hypothetical protein A3A28_00570 [Candidatus Sungbacteria bacterium RIFCSPLOWO2_01_FULL_47_32]
MNDILSNYPMLIIPVIVGGFAQLLKFCIFTLRHGWQPEYALTHGHMPSAHTAFIISLLTATGHYQGLGSGAFAATAGLAIIVIDDAVRLRAYMGDQGRYLNMLIRQLRVDDSRFPRLKERMGHRISEVVIGGVIGLFFTIYLTRFF